MNELVKKEFKNMEAICFTTDLDWAPEPAIKLMLEYLAMNHIKPTVFVTHESGIIKSKKYDIDLGIHPNFIQPSSQGNNNREIIDYCQAIIPDSEVFRCHRWYASNDIYDELSARGFKYESNICTNMDWLCPFEHRSGMISFPVFWEDGAYIQHGYRLEYKFLREKIMTPGLKILNMHPMHFALNTPYFKYTRSIKDALSREEWNNMTEEKLQEMSFGGNGIRTVIQEMVEDIVNSKKRIVTLKEMYALANSDR